MHWFAVISVAEEDVKPANGCRGRAAGTGCGRCPQQSEKHTLSDPVFQPLELTHVWTCPGQLFKFFFSLFFPVETNFSSLLGRHQVFVSDLKFSVCLNPPGVFSTHKIPVSCKRIHN